MRPRTRVELYFSSRFEGTPGGIAFSPGRLVLLGEHVDHQGGPVLAAPLALGIHVAWGIRPDRRVSTHALNARATDKFEPGLAQRSGRRWADLVRGLFTRLTEEGRRLPGLNLAIFGDLPPGRGLASSAAYLTAVLRAVFTAIEEELDPAYAARLVAEIERDWGGAACGWMDPYVVLAGVPGEILHVDTRRLEHDTFAMPPGLTLDAEDTGIERRLDQTPYNQRRKELVAARDHVRRARGDSAGLVDLDMPAFETATDGLDDALRRRARHVVTEVARVRRGAEAIQGGDGAALGALLDECHASLAQDFECSLPEIDAQVAALQSEPDVLGARLQGAGWGGSLAVLRRRPN